MRKIHKFGLAVVKEQTLLIVREHETSFFLIPGGRPHANETPLDTLQREIREELNCDLDVDSLQVLGDYSDVAANQPDAIITISLYSGDLAGEPEPASEIAELRWFDARTDDPKVLAPSIRNKILPDLQTRGLL